MSHSRLQLDRGSWPRTVLCRTSSSIPCRAAVRPSRIPPFLNAKKHRAVSRYGRFAVTSCYALLGSGCRDCWESSDDISPFSWRQSNCFFFDQTQPDKQHRNACMLDEMKAWKEAIKCLYVDIIDGHRFDLAHRQLAVDVIHENNRIFICLFIYDIIIQTFLLRCVVLCDSF